MPKKGYTQSPEHVAAKAAAVSKALKGKKQSPQHVAARQAGMARVRAATVRVSRNDAAMLEVLRAHLRKVADAHEAIANDSNVQSDQHWGIGGTRFNTEEAFIAFQALGRAHADLNKFGNLWLDGEDVLLAKLSQQ
ncbi:hypothetical protein [Rhizobium sp. 2MFCol3.1]|uniref:hypothetical protein n=1 Tax=Rhizobium sp. 2MFCol3.1 TaxID=1246459 RepID=UPI00037519BF|nr:hypothetical protein [Rhizobium sp. 2MFCol3.1]